VTSPYKKQAFRVRLGYALRGFAHGFSSEASLKFQAGAGAGALIALLMLRPAPVWWALVLLAIAAVLAAELFNTAIEQLADELQRENSPGIGIVKDCAAAAVLMAAVGALGVAVAFALHVINK
jgi:undecaprenol kinase